MMELLVGIFSGLVIAVLLLICLWVGSKLPWK
jgi:hypothetical protein